MITIDIGGCYESELRSRWMDDMTEDSRGADYVTGCESVEKLVGWAGPPVIWMGMAGCALPEKLDRSSRHRSP